VKYSLEGEPGTYKLSTVHISIPSVTWGVVGARDFGGVSAVDAG